MKKILSHRMKSFVISLLLIWSFFPRIAHAWEVTTVFGITVHGGNGGTPLNDLIGQLLNIMYGLAGALAVLMLIFGGFRYITAGGDYKLAGEAKETIQSAFTGLLLILFAFAIAHLLESVLFPAGSTPITNPQL